MAAISTHIKGDLARDLMLVTKMAESSLAMVKKARLGVDNLKLTMGQNTVVTLEAKVGTLEGHIQYLQTLVTESSDLMLEINNGKIPIANLTTGSATGTAGTVTQAEFDGYKATQERELALLRQEIYGGG